MFPEWQYQNGLPVFLEILYSVSQNTAVQKDVRIKDVRISSIQNNLFLWKVYKN